MNPRIKIGTALAGAVLAATALAAPASAEVANLVNNGTFDTGVQGWDPTPAAQFEKFGGVARLMNIADSQVQITASVSQCIDLDPAHDYRLSARRMIPGGQQRTGETWFTAYLYSGDNCVGDQVGAKDVLSLSSTGAWKTTNDFIVNGEQANSVLLRFNVRKFATDDAELASQYFTAFVDDITVSEFEPFGSVCYCGPTEEPVPEEPTSPVEPVAPTDPPGEPEPPAPPAEEPPVFDLDPPAPTETPVPPASGDHEPDKDTPQPNQPHPADPTAVPTTANDAGSPADNGDEVPTLEPQPQGPPAAVTPTPGAPATGGDSTDEPASDFSSEGQGTDRVEAQGVDGSGGGVNLALAGGSLVLLLAGVGIGIALRRVYTNR